MQAVTITLPNQPLPLSRCFVNVFRNGRADSGDYVAWKFDTDRHLRKFHPYAIGAKGRPVIAGDVTVRVFVKRPDKRRRDLDNLHKAALDTLSRNHVIEDDSRIVDLRIRWDDEIPHKTVIEVEAA